MQIELMNGQHLTMEDSILASAEMAIGKRDECGINENVKQCQQYSFKVPHLY